MKRVLGIQFNEIKLNESQMPVNGIEQVQLLRVGDFNHTIYGKFQIKKETLLSLKENFEKGVRRIELAVDYFHESDKVAAGWIKSVELREDDTELWIEVDWTKSARQKLEERELRYISADFDFNYVDSETSLNYGPTLLGAGLTNRPHVKDMQPIVMDEGEVNNILLEDNNTSKELSMDFEQIKEALKNLDADQKAQVFEMLKGEMPLTEKEMDEHSKEKEMGEEKEMMEKKLSEANTQIEELKAAIAKTERESKFNVMLSEGKVVEAQRDAYIDGNFDKFLECAVEVNLSESGTGTESTEVNTEDAEVKLSEIAEKISEEKKLDYSEAMSIALDENPELAKKFN